MDCKEFREVLDLYVDGELTSEASTEASFHLKECARCRKAEREILRLRNAMKSAVSKHKPPPELVNAVRRISKSSWPTVRGVGSERQTSIGRLLWSEKVALPAPVLALILLAVVGLAIVTGYLTTRATEPTVALREASQTQIRKLSIQDPMDVSRFDKGDRAILYTVRR